MGRIVFLSRTTSYPSVTRSLTTRNVACRADSNQGFGFLNAASLLPQGPIVSGVKRGWQFSFQTMMTELAPQDAKGGYQRPSYVFGDTIGEPQGFPREPTNMQDVDPTIVKYPLEAKRYNLYLGNACPWCHRVILAMAILNLSQYISVTWLLDDAERASRGGWVFDPETGLDPVFGARDLREVYDRCSPGFSGRCTAPLLVDRVSQNAVCNDSSILLDNLYRIAKATDDGSGRNIDLKPEHLADEINSLNDLIYKKVNNAVYRSGFATEQLAYNEAQRDLEEGLSEVENRLSKSRFLTGDYFTDADLRLFPTIARYDAVYNSLFRCTRRRISADFPNLQAWMQDVWLLPCPGALQVENTFNLEGARASYYGQLFPLNPSGIIPVGPSKEDLRLGLDPGRGSREGASVFFSTESKPQPPATSVSL